METWAFRLLLTGVADTSVVNLNAHFVGTGRSNLNVLNGKRLSGSPGNGGLREENELLFKKHWND